METTLQQNIAGLESWLEAADRQGRAESDSLNQLVSKVAKIAGVYPVPNVAVEVCLSIYTKTLHEQLESNASREHILQACRIAYCSAMPFITDADSILELIACVVYGMSIGAIPGIEGTRLLYGAQVAKSALPSVSREKKRSKSPRKRAQVTKSTPTASAA